MKPQYPAIFSLLAGICVLSTGGGDNNATTFTRDLSGFWTSGTAVTLKGLGWASGSAGISNTTATATFREPGTVSAYDTVDDVVVGTATDNLVAGRETSATRTGFYPDPNVLIDNLGGGRYRATAPTAPGAAREFFRFKINQP